MTSAFIPMVSHLRALPMFYGLDETTLERIAAGASEINARSGTLIFSRGDFCRGLYIVIAGQVKLALQAAQGSEKIVELVGPGGTFGETAIFLDRPYLFTASTLVDTRLALVSKAAVLAELEHTSRFTRAMIESLSHRMRYLIGALEDCMLRSGTERVIGYLLNRLPAGAVNGQAIVTLQEKKGIIASQLNLTHEHFSRILRGLATAAMVEVDGRTVRIRDVDRLRTYCLEA